MCSCDHGHLRCTSTVSVKRFVASFPGRGHDLGYKGRRLVHACSCLSTYIENGSITSLISVDIISQKMKLQWLVLAPFLLPGLTSGKGTGRVTLLCVEGERKEGRKGGREEGRKEGREGGREGRKEGKKEGAWRPILSIISQDHLLKLQ